ncbi:MAG: hypothetical protein RSD40_06595 [Bacilli bacterium]
MYHLELITDLVKIKEMAIEDYESAIQTISEVIKELELKNNFIFNINYQEYLEN